MEIQECDSETLKMIPRVSEDSCADFVKLEHKKDECFDKILSDTQSESTLSKRQQKKIRKKEKWEQRKGEKR